MAAGGHVITRRRRLLSLFVGASTGGFLVFIGFLFIPEYRAALLAIPAVVFAMVVTWVMFTLAFLVAIAPVALLWAWVERKHSLGWKAAAVWGGLLGALCSAAPFAALLTTFLNKYGFPSSFSVSAVSFPPSLLVFAVACPLIGCLVALATWRYAYRRRPVTEVAETFS